MEERKKKILRAIVDEYIETAEPVSSNTIVQKYEPNISSATVRNDIAYILLQMELFLRMYVFFQYILFFQVLPYHF